VTGSVTPASHVPGKPEIRSTKSEASPKRQILMTKTELRASACPPSRPCFGHCRFCHLNLIRASEFGFRISRAKRTSQKNPNFEHSLLKPRYPFSGPDVL